MILWFLLAIALLIYLMLPRIDQFCFRLLVSNAEWVFLVAQLIMCVAITMYQTSFETDLYRKYNDDDVGVVLFFVAHAVKQFFWLCAACVIISLDSVIAPRWIKLLSLASFVFYNIYTVIYQSVLFPDHFASPVLCVVSCTSTVQTRMNTLVQLSVFGIKYLIALTRTRGVMVVLRSTVRFQVQGGR